MTSHDIRAFGQDVTGCLGRALADASITPEYRSALCATLSLPGNLLSEAPDLRWARPVWFCANAAATASTPGQYDRLVSAAAAVEANMVALDLLDDVEDGESNPVLEMYGLPATVNASTGLIYLAQHMLLSLDDGLALASILARFALRATSGQHADLTLATDMNLTLDVSMEITGRKSGSLMAAACQLGAAAAGADQARQECFARFGYLAGVVAQLANDIVALSPAAAGKTDRSLSRPTLPLVFAAWCGAPAPERGESLPKCTDDGSRFAWAVAASYRAHAIDLVPAMTTDPRHQAGLVQLLHPL